ncbi:heme exporter protein CcmD [Phenylobacterium sp.]
MSVFDIPYAAYIWPAFGVTAAVFTGMIGFSLNHARRWKRRAEDLGRR